MQLRSKKKYQSTLVILTMFVMAFGSRGLASSEHEQHKNNASKESRKPLQGKVKKNILSALEANEALHFAFFKYNGEEVEKAAKRLKKAIDNIKETEVSKLLKFSQVKLSEIKASHERKLNNQNYHLVSMALIHIVNTYDLGNQYNAYSCPHVKQKWVQNSQKIDRVHNPYASSMPHCGSKDTRY